MIRKATAADVDAIAEIYEHIHGEEALGHVHTGWIQGQYPVKATAQAGLDRGDMFVYEKDGVVVASAVINQIQVDVYVDGDWIYDAKDEEVMVLHTLSVEPKLKQQGIGREFVQYYEDYAREHGCTVLRMDTNGANSIARSFYAKLGFREAGIIPCVFNGIPNVPLVLLEKKIEG